MKNVNIEGINYTVRPLEELINSQIIKEFAPTYSKHDVLEVIDKLDTSREINYESEREIAEKVNFEDTTVYGRGSIEVWYNGALTDINIIFEVTLEDYDQEDLCYYNSGAHVIGWDW